MFKTQLSSNLISEKVVIAVVPVITFFSWTALPIMIAVAVFLLMLILVPYSIYTIYMAPLNISYDASFVFITDRKTEKIITLKSISQIRPVSSYGSLRKGWEICYIENGVEEELFFHPIDGPGSLLPFMKAVRAQNPMAHCADVN
ncbi:MAG: hypothetical protein ACHQHN_18880 [Sphingobacteriales bacterium]